MQVRSANVTMLWLFVDYRTCTCKRVKLWEYFLLLELWTDCCSSSDWYSPKIITSIWNMLWHVERVHARMHATCVQLFNNKKYMF